MASTFCMGEPERFMETGEEKRRGSEDDPFFASSERKERNWRPALWYVFRFRIPDAGDKTD